MPELRNRIESPARTTVNVPALETGLGGGMTVAPDRIVREDLRRQIARLERRLGELFASAFPRQGIEWRVGAVGGPRVLGTGELERVRDALVVRLREAEAELGRRAEQEEASRGLLERMIAEPDRYRWVKISNDDIGEPGCGHYHSRPRWGILGLLLNWWRVRISSGCPLASGPRPPFQSEQAPIRKPPYPDTAEWALSARSAVRSGRPRRSGPPGRSAWRRDSEPMPRMSGRRRRGGRSP